MSMLVMFAVGVALVFIMIVLTIPHLDSGPLAMTPLYRSLPPDAEVSTFQCHPSQSRRDWKEVSPFDLELVAAFVFDLLQ